MLSEAQYNNLMENLYLRSNPTNYENLMASVAQLKAGAAHRHELHDCEDVDNDE